MPSSAHSVMHTVSRTLPTPRSQSAGSSIVLISTSTTTLLGCSDKARLVGGVRTVLCMPKALATNCGYNPPSSFSPSSFKRPFFASQSSGILTLDRQICFRIIQSPTAHFRSP